MQYCDYNLENWEKSRGKVVHIPLKEEAAKVVGISLSLEKSTQSKYLESRSESQPCHLPLGGLKQVT